VTRLALLANQGASTLTFRGRLLGAMAAAGHQVTVLTPPIPPDQERAFRDLGVDHRPIPLDRTGLRPLRDARSVLALTAILARLRPDIVLTYNIKPVIYGTVAARAARVPFRAAMITGLGHAFVDRSPRGRLLNRLVRLLYRRALPHCDVVFFQNPDDLQLFRQHRLLGGARAVLVDGEGVDVDHFASVPPPAGAPTFLLVGRVIREKGIEEYVQAARRLKVSHPQARFQLLGPYDANPSALSREQVAAWEREGVLEYLGQTSDVRPFLAACTVYVLPSWREGTPVSVLEALSTGRPVVTTDVPGCRETVVDGDNGFLVPAHDPRSLADAMERFVLEPGLAQEMGRRSREIAVERYDVHKVNADLFRHLELSG